MTSPLVPCPVPDCYELGDGTRCEHHPKPTNSINRSKRLRVYERDNYTCQICGKVHRPGSGDLTLDHIIPTSGGGSNQMDNLQTACSRCNLLKGGKFR